MYISINFSITISITAQRVLLRLAPSLYTLPSVKTLRVGGIMRYEGGVREGQNLYHCDPWVKTTLESLYFQFL